MIRTIEKEDMDYARARAAEYLTDNGCTDITLQELTCIACLIVIERQKAVEDAR